MTCLLLEAKNNKWLLTVLSSGVLYSMCTVRHVYTAMLEHRPLQRIVIIGVALPWLLLSLRQPITSGTGMLLIQQFCKMLKHEPYVVNALLSSTYVNILAKLAVHTLTFCKKH